MAQRSAIQLRPLQPPLGQEPVHQLGKPVIVVSSLPAWTNRSRVQSLRMPYRSIDVKEAKFAMKIGGEYRLENISLRQ
jgi:hypothetical protein